MIAMIILVKKGGVFITSGYFLLKASIMITKRYVEKPLLNLNPPVGKSSGVASFIRLFVTL